MVEVSIIIPCYNHGKFLPETIDSLKNIDTQKVEVIIINDGSTDIETIKVLEDLEKKGYYVINKMNEGLGAARNTGIKESKGKYILPLDSDNRIEIEYITKALSIFKSDSNIDIVYSDKYLFGILQGEDKLPDFNLQKMMLENYIDACAFFKKELWEKLEGFDEKMPYMGYEDWDFWLRSSFAGANFYHIPKCLFHYRVEHTSMLKSMAGIKKKAVRDYLFTKHNQYLNPLEIELYFFQRFSSNPIAFTLKLFIRKFLPKLYSKFILKGYIRENL
jgi:glycosyltransferase involved in cell wall biosynthesis